MHIGLTNKYMSYTCFKSIKLLNYYKINITKWIIIIIINVSYLYIHIYEL